jgi:hypothetical protein
MSRKCNIFSELKSATRTERLAQYSVDAGILVSTVAYSSICSDEHESVSAASLGANITQIIRKTSTAGVEVVDSTLKPLKAALEAIRDMASNALTQIEQPQETRSMRWVCKERYYVKHFTKPVSLETAGRCRRCKSQAFNPIL